MSLSWECAFARGEPAGQKALACTSAIVSIGLLESPLLAAAIEAGDDGFASQIAVKMSTEAILTAGFDAFRDSESSPEPIELIKAGFKTANDKVYEYSHRMAAGGTFAAKAIVAAIDHERVTLGQLGGCEGFLLRDGTLLSFYQSSTIEPGAPRDALLARFIGANVKIAVDMSSMDAEIGDRIAICTRALGAEKREILAAVLAEADNAKEAANEIAARCLTSSAHVGDSFVRPMVFVFFAFNEN
ncbi:MAG: hypothetical protein KDD66_12265 [Bdellovibrionales bacterium]|nr:hypothetical protein [Bdellovibrionales bacterium]